jgi:hypothetical protein
MASAVAGFSFSLPAQIAEQAAGTSGIQVTTASGQPLPDWLRFIPETHSFVATAVPDGAFPLQVIVAVGATRTTVVISEKSE